MSFISVVHQKKVPYPLLTYYLSKCHILVSRFWWDTKLISAGVCPLLKYLLDFILDIYSTQRWQLGLPAFFRVFCLVLVFWMRANIDRWNQ